MGQLTGMRSAAGVHWQPVSLREAGFAGDLTARLDKAIADKRIWNFTASSCATENWCSSATSRVHGEGSRPIGVVSFKPDAPHDLRSVSKSIVGLLYGISLPPARCRRRKIT